MNELQPMDLQCVKCRDCSLCMVVTWESSCCSAAEPPQACLFDAFSRAQTAGDMDNFSECP